LPRIPTYVSSNQLTKDAPNRLVDAASFQVNDNTGEILSEQGKAIQSAAAQMERVRDISENTSAQTAAAKGFSEIHLEAIESPDIWNAGKTAQDKISKLRGELSSKITSDIARAQFEAAFDTDAMQYTNRISAELRQRQALSATNSLIEYEDGKTAEFSAPDTTPYDQQMILSGLNEKYLEYVKAGIIRPEVAAAKFKEAKERMVNTYADNYVATYPGIALEELNAGKDGLFANLKEDKRLELEKTAKALIDKTTKENEIAIKKVRNDEASNLLTEKINGTLTVQKVKDKLSEGKIEPQDADSLLRSLNSTKVDIITKDETFIEFTTKYADMKARGNKATLDEIAQFRSDTMKAHADGLLDESDAQKFLKDTQKAFDDRIKTAADTAMNKANPKGFLQAISVWSDENAEKCPEVKARMVRNLMGRIESGEDPTEAVQNIIKDEIKNLKPNTILSGGTPNNVMDRESGVKNVYLGRSDSKADYSVRDGQVVAKGAPAGKIVPVKKYATGDKIRVKGTDYVVVGFYEDGEPELEPVNAKIK